MRNLKEPMMLERLFRLIWACVMFATLFVKDNWFLILEVLLEALPGLFGPHGEIYTMSFIDWLFLFVILSRAFGVPLLGLFNMLLVFDPFNRRLKTVYRICVLILFLLAWCLAFVFDPSLREVGFWANTAVITVAGLVEIAFLVRERLGKPQDTSP